MHQHRNAQIQRSSKSSRQKSVLLKMACSVLSPAQLHEHGRLTCSALCAMSQRRPVRPVLDDRPTALSVRCRLAAARVPQTPAPLAADLQRRWLSDETPAPLAADCSVAGYLTAVQRRRRPCSAPAAGAPGLYPAQRVAPETTGHNTSVLSKAERQAPQLRRACTHHAGFPRRAARRWKSLSPTHEFTSSPTLDSGAD